MLRDWWQPVKVHTNIDANVDDNVYLYMPATPKTKSMPKAMGILHPCTGTGIINGVHV